MLQAHRDVGMLEHEPVAARPPAVEVELDHHASSRQAMSMDAAAHPPEQHDRIELRWSRVPECPARPPDAEDVDHALELTAGRGEMVGGGTRSRTRAPLDDPRSFQSPESLGEQGARDAGQAAVELVEVTDARQELPNDQRGPAVGQDLRGASDGTVLAVQIHGGHLQLLGVGQLGSVIVLGRARAVPHAAPIEILRRGGDNDGARDIHAA